LEKKKSEELRISRRKPSPGGETLFEEMIKLKRTLEKQGNKKTEADQAETNS